MNRLFISMQPTLKQTEVLIAPGLLFADSLVAEIQVLASRFALFCDETVAELWGKRWLEHLQKKGLEVSVFTFPAGEQEKSRERKAELEDLLFAQKFGKDTGILALGGGVVTDLVGYVAATFYRGLPLINIPTTLLGMVDAAIGGKTSVNTRAGKNLIGTFYPAEKVVIDFDVLTTLPSWEETNGIAEIIKYALIRSPTLFHLLQNFSANKEQIIHESIKIKNEVVTVDFEEKTGLRRILNFGHTIAHALELLENYQISHGEAVAIGMLVESFISVKMGLLAKEEFEEIQTCICSFPFALKAKSSFTLEQLYAALLLDKKATHKGPRFVLIDKIGSCCAFGGSYCTEVPPALLEEAVAWMLQAFYGAYA